LAQEVGIPQAVAEADRSRAFEAAVHEHQAMVYSVAYHFLQDHAVAEELAQEVFLRVYRSRQTYRAEAKFSTWLYRIATNTALDLIRGRKRHQQGREPEDEQGVAAVDKLAAESPSPDRLMLSSELRERVTAALGRLSPAERAAFVLRHFEGQGIETIAATLGLRQGAAKNTIFRAVQKLRGELELYAAASE